MDPIKLDPNAVEIARAVLADIDEYADHGTSHDKLARDASELASAVLRAPALSSETDQGYANHETMLAATYLAGNMTPGGPEHVERVRATVRLGMRRAEHEQREQAPAVADTLHEAVEAQLTRTARRGHPAGVELEHGLGDDLLHAALARVDWLELAREQLEELASERETDGDREEDRRIAHHQRTGRWEA